MPTEKLQRILQLEAEKLDDRAVVGGLGRYVATWLRECDGHYGSEATEWVQSVAKGLSSYSLLDDEAARREAISELLALVAAGPGGSSGTVSPQRDPSLNLAMRKAGQIFPTLYHQSLRV